MIVVVLIGSLQAYEQRLLKKKEDNESQALQSRLSLREDKKTSNYERSQRE